MFLQCSQTHRKYHYIFLNLLDASYLDLLIQNYLTLATAVWRSWGLLLGQKVHRHCVAEISRWASVQIWNRNAATTEFCALLPPLLLLRLILDQTLVGMRGLHLCQQGLCCDRRRCRLQCVLRKCLCMFSWPGNKQGSDCRSLAWNTAPAEQLFYLFFFLNFLVEPVIRACLSPDCEVDCARYALC